VDIATASFAILGTQESALQKKGLKEAVDRLKPFFTGKSPFENPPKIPEKIQWVKPAFVCEVAFAEDSRWRAVADNMSNKCPNASRTSLNRGVGRSGFEPLNA
jgi:hypothetical protein